MASKDKMATYTINTEVSPITCSASRCPQSDGYRHFNPLLLSQNGPGLALVCGQ